ncbi:MAG: c-type cytochrome [Terriglobales bacterium]
MPDTRLSLGALAVAALLLAGCAGPGTKSTTEIEYQPDMYKQPYVQGLGTDRVNPSLPAMRVPPAGTIPVHYTPFPQPVDVTSMEHLINPLPVTPAVLDKGRQLFDNYCIVCHGARADGLGYIVPRMTQPPALIAGAPLLFTDGRIFSIVSSGQGNMPSYQTELDPAQRWAIVHYVRVLQRAANPTPADMARAQRQGMDFSHDLPPAQGPNGLIPGAAAIPHP